MLSFFEFISEYFFVYLWVTFTTFLNIIAPLSGSTVVNPVTAYFTDPQRAIGIMAFVAFFGGVHRVFLFRKEIVSDEKNIRVLISMLPVSIIGAVGGGLFVSYINIKLLTIIVVVISLYFMISTLLHLFKNKKKESKNKGFGFFFVALLSGFLQGSGMPGSDIRNNYLRTVMSELSVRGITSAIGLVNFFISGSILLISNKLTQRDFIFVIAVVPCLLLVQLYGKTFLEKMKDRNAKLLAVSLSLVGVVLLTYKYLL